MVDFPSQRPVTLSVDVFFDLRLNKRYANDRDAGDFRCHRAHYDITIMDRDFRRRDTHVAAPHWGHVLVLTAQGKCFPNLKARPWWKRCISLQWRCMSDIVSQISDFCSRNSFLIYSVQCVTLPFLLWVRGTPSARTRAKCLGRGSSARVALSARAAIAWRGEWAALPTHLPRTCHAMPTQCNCGSTHVGRD